MKILKVFGVVVGIHVFALILIFANPGCSAMSKTSPSPSDTTAKAETPSPTITVPTVATGDSAGIDPNAPAVSSSPAIRYSPTRPNTSAANVLEAEPVSDVIPATTYTVGKGDSLWSIAHKNHLTKAELAAANNLRPEATLRFGQKLIIPTKAAAPTAAGAKTAAPTAAAAKGAMADATSAPAAKGSGDTVKHIVKPGETLGAIARKYQVKVGEIATANNISDPKKIHPGMELIIPGWQAPAGKSGAKTVAKAAAAPAPAKPAVIPTISVGDDQPAPAPTAAPASDAPPTITVEDAPAPKKP
jgi:LysM repeat protein